MYVGTSNKNAASSLRERLAVKKPDGGEPPADAKAEEAKEEVKEEVKPEDTTQTDLVAGNQDAKAEDAEDIEHTGQGVLLGKRGLEEDGCAADKFSKLPSGREKMSVDGEEPPAKRVSGAKEEDDSVMQLWSELTDKPNEEAEAEQGPADADVDAGKAEVCYRLFFFPCAHESSFPGASV